ncbi:hypothetical protein ACL02T_25605 [Pseudonocardia sp. RS010]|uniref:hypothetical protein n=1 Tax=Pseudonocardia sp. RS010 TaxID=3385979 RepID=UPI0039A15304
MAELNFQENHAIPGMAHMAMTFLQVVKTRTDEAGIGLEFQPKQDRRTKDYHLEAVIKFRGLLGSGHPIRLQVHSTPRGGMLHVGYTVATDEMPQFMVNLNAGNARENAMRQNLNLRPENQRELAITIDSFEQLVYVPTVQDLVDAAESARGAHGGAGFVGNT